MKLDCIVVSVATSPYTLIQGPSSCSHQLCRLVLLNRVLEHLSFSLNSHLQFQIACSYFLACVLDSSAGKAFLARSIKFVAWLITNGAVV